MKRQLVVVSAATLVAQLAAFGKLWLVARLFGVGAELDGYNLGFVLPTLISGILSGVLQTGLFPIYARIDAQADLLATARFERLVFYAVATVAGAISLILVLASAQATLLVAGDAAPAVREAAARVLPLAAFAILLNSIGDYLGYLLALRNRYAVAAAAPIANAALGAILLAAWPQGGLLNLTLGTVLGTALQGGICLGVLARVGFSAFGGLPRLGEGSRELRDMLRLGGWILPGMVFANVAASLPPMLLASYGEGAVSAFGYAYRLHQSALQLLVMAGSPVILARFSELVARGDIATLRHLLHKAGWLAGFIGIIAVPLVWWLGAPMLQLVFGTGRFDAEAASRVASHWAWLTLGLAPAIWGNALAKYLQAAGHAKLMSTLAGLGLMILWIGAGIGGWLVGEYAIPAAITLSAATGAAALAGAVRRSLAGKRSLQDAEGPEAVVPVHASDG